MEIPRKLTSSQLRDNFSKIILIFCDSRSCCCTYFSLNHAQFSSNTKKVYRAVVRDVIK